ncbi:MAG TPA: ABC transporter permease [Bryobacteraceae bacterium]|jgi:putative ABC transport system permease protein
MFGRKRRERDLDRELRDHLELEAEELHDCNAARRALGNLGLIKEDTRAMWRFSWLDRIVQDARYAVRGLRKSPAFALTAVLSLALGIGANTAIFTVVDGVLLKPLPFPEPDRLVQVWESKPAAGYFRNVVNGLNFLDWRERSHSFTDVAAISQIPSDLTGVGEPVVLSNEAVSPQFFSILGIAPALGRTFTAEEGQPGRDATAILSYRLWQSRFGGDRAAVGRKILLNGNPATIIGVMPPGFGLPKQDPDIWLPLPIFRSPIWGRGRNLTVIARLKPGVSLTQAQDDLHAVAAQSARERPAFDEGWSADAAPMLADATGSVRLPLLVLLAAVGLVLLIACANVANLLLMRSATRSREIAVRVALGAGKRRLMQQLLSESLALSLIACGLGLAIAYGGVKALLAIASRQAQLPRIDSIHVDGSVILFAFALSVVTAAVFGLVPALQVGRLGPQEALQQGAIRTAAKSFWRQSLVIAEIALSMILLVGAGLMLRSFHRLVSVNPGFETQRILTMDVFAPPGKYLDATKRAEFFMRALDEVRSVPGVRAAGSVLLLPLEGRESRSCFARENEPPPAPSHSPDAQFQVVSPGYFQTMGTALLAGRHFDARDRVGAPSVIMVNRTFVRRFFPNENPIGQKLNVCWDLNFHNPAVIVGVAADARQTELQTAPEPTIFIDNLQAPVLPLSLVVRADGDPLLLARSVQTAARRLNPDLAFAHVQTMERVFSDSVGQSRLQLVLLLVFGGIAGLLTIVGIYGVVAYSAAQRTREIAIRVALGARPAEVRRMVLREGLIMAAAGVAIGVAGALGLTRVLRSLLFETTPSDPATIAASAITVVLLGLIATLIPANRASGIDPMKALKYE